MMLLKQNIQLYYLHVHLMYIMYRRGDDGDMSNEWCFLTIYALALRGPGCGAQQTPPFDYLT